MQSGSSLQPISPFSPLQSGFVSRGLTALFAVLAPCLAIAGEPIEAFTEPYRTASVVTTQAGLIESLAVKDGDRVSMGTPLGSLDCAVLRVQRKITQAKVESTGELQAAVAELELRANLLERYSELEARSQGASAIEVERKRADVAIQQAKVQAVRDSLALSRLEVELLDEQIRQRTLLSPIDGLVTDIAMQVGDYVAPGQQMAVVTVVDIDRLKGTFHVPTELLSSISQGSRVSVQLPDESRVVGAEVEYVSPITDPRTGTFKVRIVIQNNDHALRSGIRCRLDLNKNLRR